jgi:uncharacterized membrane protein YiaA
MSFRDYLHEKAEESRHLETLAYIMFLTGAVLFIGGTLETLTLSGEPKWLWLIPYRTESTMGAYLGLTLVITGICMAVAGIVVGLNHSRERGWYMKELRMAGAPADHIVLGKMSKNELINGKIKERS